MLIACCIEQRHCSVTKSKTFRAENDGKPIVWAIQIMLTRLLVKIFLQTERVLHLVQQPLPPQLFPRPSASLKRPSLTSRGCATSLEKI